MTSHNRAFAIPVLSLSLAAALGALPLRSHAAAPDTATLSVSPNPTAAGKAFTLYLNGTDAQCGTVFSQQSVAVAGRTISLTYLPTTPEIMKPLDDTGASAKTKPPINTCPIYAQPLRNAAGSVVVDTSVILPAPYLPRPAFSLPALSAGAYSVSVIKLLPCMVSTPSCKIAVVPVSAGTLTVQGTVMPFTISPESTSAGKAFQLTLQSYDYNCGTTFDHLNATANGDQIRLTYQPHDNPAAICPAIYRPYGPTFSLPPLKAGNYKVTAYRLPECAACDTTGITSSAGTLTVTEGEARKGWFLKNKVVPPDNAFSMQLLNQDYGNCNTAFTHTSAYVGDSGIYARFVIEDHPEYECFVDLYPSGPVFAMPALKMGFYPVFAVEQALCQVVAPYCLTPIHALPALASDTLVVAETIVARISELRAQAPKVDVIGSHAVFRLPEGIGGTWKAELVTLSGRRLSAASIQGEGGSRVEFELGAGLKAGVYLLRLHGPDGDSRLLPIVRKD